MTVAAPETHEFQAEVKQVLDIVVHSLYTDKEIFIRELVSNASDALEKLRHLQLTEKKVFDNNLDLEISVTTDDAAGTLTIQDFGIGMTRDELVENLGTIAHSGSKAFLEAMKADGKPNENLIGQFGVGFYSAFMVAKDVTVYSRTWQEEGEGQQWQSDGSGKYQIEAAEGQRRGTKIVVSLKDEYKEFATESRVKEILEQYSSFVEFPVKLNGTQVNTTKAIWLKSKNDITEEEYKEFYKFQGKAHDEPIDWLHFSADAPLSINALLYIPSFNPEMPGFGQTESTVALHCRKVLIDAQPKNLLPEWLRFAKGVIDSADLPLNISRESMQDSALMQKLNTVMTKRFIKFLDSIAKKDADKYRKIWDTFGRFIKEGASSDYTHRDGLAKLLRFESSMSDSGELVSLQQYLDRMKEGQEEIYFINGPSRSSIENGPYLEAFKARGIEVLYCYEPIDDFVLNNLGKFEEKQLVSADQDEIKLDPADAEQKGEALEADQVKSLCEWLQETIGKEKIKEVSAGDRLIDSPIVALNADKFMTTHMRRMMAGMQQGGENPFSAVNLQINPRHALIKNLSNIKDSNAELAKLVAEQLYDNALISAGLLEDPRSMVNRMNGLLERLSK